MWGKVLQYSKEIFFNFKIWKSLIFGCDLNNWMYIFRTLANNEVEKVEPGKLDNPENVKIVGK